MRFLISTALALLAFSCAVSPARSQSPSLVVAVCGTLPLAYAPGSVRNDTVDVNGNKCTSGTVTITGVATAANQVLQITQETAINALLGLQADAACATDNGTCTLAALVKRLNQRLTTLNTTLSTPFQAGGSIGNTGFIANAGTNLNTSALALDATVGTTNTNLGAPGATACATDTGSCSGNALLQRLAQRLTTVNTTLNTPMQATGGTVTQLPTAGAITSTSITVTNASGAFLAASTAAKFLMCKNESTSASIALNFANGTAVLNTAGNVTLPPGASIVFDGTQVPTGAITGISSAATSPATCLSS